MALLLACECCKRKDELVGGYPTARAALEGAGWAIWEAKGKVYGVCVDCRNRKVL